MNAKGLLDAARNLRPARLGGRRGDDDRDNVRLGDDDRDNGRAAAPGGPRATQGRVVLEPPQPETLVDLRRRRDQLSARVNELQWDLGGLVYEMAIRDHIRIDVLVRRAALLQDADAELSEVQRILRLEESGTAGACATCGAPHSSGAVYCWQCGQPLLEHVATQSIATP